ncbi:MAG: biopolymer transporter ExbD [Burkholderiales bacterium]|jgi:biopolymer transport protein ExbD|nr:biopolymer transporter ExbD [Burkholderiales bacterium]
MKFRGNVKEDPEINLIPLIDVLLVILIFLMITTTYSRFAELNITLPSADAAKALDRPNEINVAVTSAGQYVIDKRPVTFRDVAGLAEDLKRAAGELKEPTVVIDADASATHQSVIHVMEAARLAGYTQVTFTTQATPK